jgi:hypothetical protein
MLNQHGHPKGLSRFSHPRRPGRHGNLRNCLRHGRDLHAPRHQQWRWTASARVLGPGRALHASLPPSRPHATRVGGISASERIGLKTPASRTEYRVGTGGSRCDWLSRGPAATCYPGADTGGKIDASARSHTKKVRLLPASKILPSGRSTSPPTYDCAWH